VRLILGVDVGQRQEPSGLCAVEVQQRKENGGRLRYHYVVRFLEQIGAGARFPEIAGRVGELAAALDRQTGSCPEVYVDATGLGQPVISLFDGELHCARVQPVYFNHGDRRLVEGLEVRLGKAWLVTRLQTLLQADQLHLPWTAVAKDLARELNDYQIRVEPGASELAGAFRVGRYDDLVTALGLAVQEDPVGPGIF
jgi:hypothetical protein